jgi:recombination protein RecA
VKVVKNKVASPFREAEVDILFGEGISREGDLLDLGAEQGIVEKSGSWFSFSGERLGQGRETARTFLKEHPEVRGRIDVAVRQKLGLGKADAVPVKPVIEEKSKSSVSQTA